MIDNDDTFIKNKDTYLKNSDDTALKSGEQNTQDESTQNIVVDWKPGDMVLGFYEVNRELGTGGFGKVFQVHHRNWNIDLAVKVPKPESFKSKIAKENFVTEAQTWVGLGLYPNIVCCYYVRTHGGVPSVFAEYVDAGSLSDWIKSGKLYHGGKEKALERILDFSIQFAWGLDYAHEMGLVHQDIKPANVMITGDGTVKVTDFGLAKARALAGEKKKENNEESIMMSSGGMTPAYCSPEQASGEKISRKTDIWSFGVSLLEMFTGEVTWMSGVAAPMVLEKILEEGSSEKLPDMPGEIVSLLKKCFESESDKRPSSMKEIFKELEKIYYNTTDNEYKRKRPSPIQMRADTLNNMGAAYLDLRKQKEAYKCFNDAVKADPKHLEGLFNKGYMEWQKAEISGSEYLKTIRDLEVDQKDNPEYWNLLSWILLEQGKIDEIEIIQSTKHRTDDKQLLKALSIDSKSEVTEINRFSGYKFAVDVICISPDNRFIATGDSNCLIECWNIEKKKKLRHSFRHTSLKAICFSEDSKTLLSAGAFSVNLWDFENGSQTAEYKCQNKNMDFARFSPDGRYIASLGFLPGNPHDKSLVCYNAHTGEKIFYTEKESFSTVFNRGAAFYFKKNGNFLIAGTRGSGYYIELWDSEQRQTILFFKGHKNYMSSVCFSNDGKYLISGSYDNTIRLWDVDTGSEMQCFTGHTSEITSLCFTSDKKNIISGSSDKTVRIWDINNGRELFCIKKHKNNVNSVFVSDKDNYILSAGYDKYICLHQFQLSKDSFRAYHPYPVLKKPKAVKAVSALDSEYQDKLKIVKQYITGNNFPEAVKVLNQLISIDEYKRDSKAWGLLNYCGRAYGKNIGIKDIALRRTIKGHTGWVTSLCITADGNFIVSGSQDTSVRIWDPETVREIKQLKGHSKDVTAVCCSQDNRYILSASLDKTVRLWDFKNGTEITQLEGHTGDVYAVCISTDNRYALTGSGDYFSKVDNTVRLWDLEKGSEIICFRGHRNDVTYVSFYLNNTSVISGSKDGSVRIWSTGTGKEISTHPVGDRAFSLSRDGKYMASASYQENEILLWNMKKGKIIKTLYGHTDNVGALHISPENSFILSGGDDNTVRIWELSSGKEIQCLKNHDHFVSSVCFSSDGRYIVSGGNDFRISMWEIFHDWKF